MQAKKITITIILAVMVIGVPLLYAIYRNNSPSVGSDQIQTTQQPANVDNTVKNAQPAGQADQTRTAQGKIKGFAENVIYIERGDGSGEMLKMDPAKPVYITDEKDPKKILTLAALKAGDEISAQIATDGNVIVITIKSK